MIDPVLEQRFVNGEELRQTVVPMQWYIDGRECCVRIRDKFDMTKGIERESAAERGPKAEHKKSVKWKRESFSRGFILCSCFLGVYAQGTTGTISGTVKDQQGAAVA